MPTDTPRQRRKLSAILMVDVSGFSRMMGQNEEGTTVLIREFHARTQALVEDHEGRVVDTAGDSVFAEFDSVVNAMRCAQAIQQEQSAANADRRTEDPIEIRIGVHLGDVIVEEYHVYGDGVNIAARLESVAGPGEIYVSEAVYQQVHNKLDLDFEDLGVQELKNIQHPIRLYRVASQTRGPQASLPQIPKRDQPPNEPSVIGCWREEFLREGNLIRLVAAACLLATPCFFSPRVASSLLRARSSPVSRSAVYGRDTRVGPAIPSSRSAPQSRWVPSSRIGAA